MAMTNPQHISSAGADVVEVNSSNVQVRQLRDRHRFMLALAVFVIAVSFCLRFRQGGVLRLPWSSTELPAVCTSRLLFDVECPGCGLTRSFVALASGDFAASFRYHRVGWLLALAILAQVPYRVFALRELRQRVVSRPWLAWFGYLLIAALIANWLLKIVMPSIQ
jgi:hypothetical protein